MIGAAAAVLVLLLVLLAGWQRRIDAARRRSVERDVEEARQNGSDRPIGQHPHIDVQACLGCGSCIRACPENGVLELFEGIARVVHVSRCVGHGLCADACPVGAIQVGLGDLTGRSDIPRLSEMLESSVPGVFIAGELGGLALIRNAVDQGTRVVAEIARRTETPSADTPDLLVVGAGPSGLAATLRAIELGLSYVTIDEGGIGGTVRKYPRRKLVMTQPVTLPLHGRMKRLEYRKEQLIDLWDEVVRHHDVRIQSGVKLLGARHEDGIVVAETSAGEIRARNLLLALGRRGTPRKLDVPGEEQEKVLYRLVDAASYTHCRILVVGGGDSAIEAATGLADQPGNTVTVSYRKPAFFRLKQRNDNRVRTYAAQGRLTLLMSSSVKSIGEDHVVLDDGQRLDNDFVFVFAGGEPPSALLRRIGVRFWSDEA